MNESTRVNPDYYSIHLVISAYSCRVCPFNSLGSNPFMIPFAVLFLSEFMGHVKVLGPLSLTMTEGDILCNMTVYAVA